MDIRRRLQKAGEFIQKKIPYSEQFMKPKHEWMQTVPTKDCDVVMLFPSSIETFTVNWLINTIKTSLPHLNITTKDQKATKSMALYISATFDSLVSGGEALRMMKITKSLYGGELIELSRKDMEMFQDSEDEEAFFTTQERQRIIMFFLNSLRSPRKEVFPGVKLREGQAVVPKFLSRGIISNVFPLHEYKNLKALKSKWVPGVLERQPIDEIQRYFGSQIAIYFAWLGHYTTALAIPAIMGIIFWNMAEKGLVAFAFLNVVWSTVWLETWKRRSAEVSYSWGNFDTHLNKFSEPRPEFKGELKKSHITGRWEPYYPSWKRNLFRYLVSLPIMLASLYVVFRVMVASLLFQDKCKEFLESKEGLSFLSFAPKALLAIPISLFDKWYSKLALWLNKKENYRSEEDYQNQLIIKLLVFRFVNSFLSLFYIAFYLQDLTRLREQLAALLLTKQLTGNFKESIVPYLKKRLQQAKLSFSLYGASKPSGGQYKKLSSKEKNSDDEDDAHNPSEASESDPNKGREIPQAEVESKMAKFNGTFKDYVEVFIQFGYVTLFSCAFPLAAAFAFVTNMIEIRSDAFKFCYVFQRPFGYRAHGIGVWQDAMEIMGVISIVVNCSLIGLSGQIEQVYPDITTAQTIFFIIVLEHVLIALKYGISYAIPDVPEWVEDEQAKKEFERREILKGNPTGTKVD